MKQHDPSRHANKGLFPTYMETILKSIGPKGHCLLLLVGVPHLLLFSLVERGKPTSIWEKHLAHNEALIIPIIYTSTTSHFGFSQIPKRIAYPQIQTRKCQCTTQLEGILLHTLYEVRRRFWIISTDESMSSHE